MTIFFYTVNNNKNTIINQGVKMEIRTDLAVECRELKNCGKTDGVTVTEQEKDSAKITLIEVCGKEGEKNIGKPQGKYYTVDLPEFSHETELLDGRLKVLTDIISEMIPDGEGTVLVAGLGNMNITPDALGPMCADLIFSTRHIPESLAKELGVSYLNSVSSVATSVLGKTGIETAEYLKGLAEFIKPKALIAVDALASRRTCRLGRTVQLTDTGITPGSGVGNHRMCIDKAYLKIPVISIGVPTVVDGKTIVYDLAGKSNEINDFDDAENFFVTPREIDTVVNRAARLIALSINCALQPHIEPEILLSLM